MGRYAFRLACAAAALAAFAAHGQTARPASPANQMAQQMQQLAADRTRLEGENQRLKSDLEKAKAEVEAAKKDRAALEGKARRAEAGAGEVARRSAANTEALEKSREQLNELVARFRETAGALRTVEQEKAELAASLATKERAYTDCARDNAELAGIAGEALDRYEKKGFWGSVGKVEPFTQLSRTRVENIAGEYRDRIEALKVEPPPGPQPPGSR